MQFAEGFQVIPSEVTQEKQQSTEQNIKSDPRFIQNNLQKIHQNFTKKIFKAQGSQKKGAEHKAKGEGEKRRVNNNNYVYM